VLVGSLRRHGIPDEILTDNGKVFTGRFGPQPVEVLFDRICRENGIAHRHTAVRSRLQPNLEPSTTITARIRFHPVPSTATPATTSVYAVADDRRGVAAWPT
jgi:hypothetical protein